MMEELRFGALLRFFDALDLGCVFAGGALKLTCAWGEQNAFNPLGMVSSAAEDVRLRFCSDLLQEVASTVKERVAEQLVTEQEYTLASVNTGEDKFSTMELGTRAIYGKGASHRYPAEGREAGSCFEG